MKTYREFIHICENVKSEEELEEGLRKRIAAAALGAGIAAGGMGGLAPKVKAADWNAGVKFGRGTTAVYGGASSGSTQQGGTAWNVRGEVGSRTATGQGDKINRGIDAAIKNYKTGSSDDTSTSSKEKRVGYGKLQGNLTTTVGSSNRPEPEVKKPEVKKPELKKPKDPKEKERVSSVRDDEKGSSSANAYQSARARLEKQGFADAGGNAYTNSSQQVMRMANSPNPAIRAQAAQAFRDMKLVGDANRASREARSTGVKRGKMGPGGVVTF